MSPGTTVYRFDLVNLLWDAAAGASPEERRVLLGRAVLVALEGAMRRPLDSELHRLLGMAELRRFQMAGEDRLGHARRAFEASARLFPTHRSTIEALAFTAGLQGDDAAQRELESRLARLRGGNEGS